MIHVGKKDKFKVAISGDTQPYSNTEVGYVRDTIPSPRSGRRCPIWRRSSSRVMCSVTT
jgi:hypothetical protein